MTTVSQRSFAGGEISPALYARADITKYITGLRTLRNFLVFRHGGAATRPGTKFVGEVKDSTKAVRLIPFVFNSDQTYMLEFGDQYIRVIRDHAYVSDLSLTITGITNANPAVLTYTGTDPTNGQEIAISGVVGAMAPFVNGRNFKIANVNAGANTLELQSMAGVNINSTSFGAYGSGGTAARVYTITSPYVEADLPTLQYVQSADVITLAHPNYAPRTLSRTGHSSWALATITFEPGISAPTGLVVDGAAGTNTFWVVTSVAEETFEESLPTGTPVGASSPPSSGSPRTLDWNTVSGAQEYNVYRKSNGLYGYIGTSGELQFVDNGITPDTTDTPPLDRDVFGSANNYPSVVTYYQQRLVFANTNNEPDTVWASKTGAYYNFGISIPVDDDSSIKFGLVGKQVNAVKHAFELGGKLLVLTSGGEWVINGDEAGIFRPTSINARQHSYNGSSDLSPIVSGGTGLYVQARGSIVRDISYDFNIDGYKGNDLTIFSSHLVDGYEIDDWAYQQIPNSIVWAVRSDGTLLGLTYVKEQEIIAWHRHDTDGLIENVAVIPYGDEDVLYMVVNRTIGGSTKRYVERMVTRQIDDIEDYIAMDSALSYDGRHTGSTTMTLSGGTNWTYLETLTLTASASTFTSTDVGNEIHLTGSDGTEIRFEITGYTGATVVTGKPNKTVPVAMRSVAIATWAEAVATVTGLWHLNGESLSVFGDGFVAANPNNDAYGTVTVSNGSITLDKPYAVIHAGLPYLCDLETLNIETVRSETMADKKKVVTSVTMQVENTRGLWVGAKPPTDDSDDPLEGLTEFKLRVDEGYDDPTALKTDSIDVNIRPEWNSNGRVFVRQVDPVPASVLSIHPGGMFPFRG